jgi:hypothetical protein|tara:strand:+ start:257 stop:1075 length:819 start_codon:yes stop_codon:yes gene_type:complete
MHNSTHKSIFPGANPTVPAAPAAVNPYPVNFDPFGSNLVNPNLGSGQIMLQSQGINYQGFNSPNPSKTTTNNNTNNKVKNSTGGTELGKILGIAAPVVAGITTAAVANRQANKARTRAEEYENTLRALESSRQEIVNPYQNVGVATAAAEMQAEEADIALANTLDTIRATGAGAGGATALAQAALKSKQGVSANIQQQEAANEKLRAQGEQFAFQVQEQREMQKLDRTAGLLDRELAQEAQYRSDIMGAVTGGISGAAQLGAAFYGGNKDKK